MRSHGGMLKVQSAMLEPFNPYRGELTRSPDSGKVEGYRCFYCTYTSKYTSNMYKHVRRMHEAQLKLCG
uniref:BED-type domain-containing protein n=1 Tax=Trichogramma kaykai TaxID=54128 RepID=A0ABD2WUS8_9HYME